jgi:hypothetical protein
MGERQNKLKALVEREFGLKTHLKPTGFELFTSKYSKDIIEIYKELGGLMDEPPTKFGPWDVSSSKFIIELDEERHFNRYRVLTLKSNLYNGETHFMVSSYKQFCKLYERGCLKAACWGKNWKNNSTEKQFGKSDIEGTFIKNGSSRWKQRAYYDFLKDVSSKILDIPIIRISIYDSIENTNIDNALNLNLETSLLKFIKSKVKLYCN